MKVREYRKKKALTQTEIAKMLGIRQDAYSKKERGIIGFNVEELLLLEDILGASISELFSDIKKEIKHK